MNGPVTSNNSCLHPSFARFIRYFVFSIGVLLSCNAHNARAQNPADKLDISRYPDERVYAVMPPYAVKHDVGQLKLQMTNLGVVGNIWLGEPSAEWEGGEYLCLAGLWIGAQVNGEPHVSTGCYELELRPSLEPIDRMYESREGYPGGNRIGVSDPADDDDDGLIDEDFHDGRDNDGDGRIDEDFAAASAEMFSCTYWDYTPEAIQDYPEHRPLNVRIQQRSLAWPSPGLQDFVAIEYHIANVGFEVLDDIYLGLFVDGDVGPLDNDEIYVDDGGYVAVIDTFLVDPTLPNCDTLQVAMNMAYMYDIPDSHAPNPGGDVDGFFGVLLLDHTTDPYFDEDAHAPGRVGVRTIRFMTAGLAYPSGEPSNDFERYDLLSVGVIPRRPTSTPDDYRYMISAGPFEQLLPGDHLRLVVAFVAGEGYYDAAMNRPDPRLGPDGLPSERSLMTNALRAVAAYEWRWMNIDGLPETGVDGKETCIAIQGGGAPRLWHDPCDSTHTVWITDTGCENPELWVDNDCNLCTPNPSHPGCESGGCETLVHWIPYVPSAVDPAHNASSSLVQIRALSNPCHEPAMIQLQLSTSSTGALWVHDALGRRIRCIGEGTWETGRHEVLWDARDAHGRAVADGVYFLRWTGSGGDAARSLILLRRLR